MKTQVQIGGEEPAAVVGVTKSQPLAVRWTTPAEGIADVTYAELRFTRGKHDLALRCRLRDDGAFDLPPDLLADLSGKVAFVLVRLRRSYFGATGLERGELRVAARDTVTLSF